MAMAMTFAIARTTAVAKALVKGLGHGHDDLGPGLGLCTIMANVILGTVGNVSVMALDLDYQHSQSGCGPLSQTVKEFGKGSSRKLFKSDSAS